MPVEWLDHLVNVGIFIVALVSLLYPLHLQNRQRANMLIRQVKKLRKSVKRHYRDDDQRFHRISRRLKRLVRSGKLAAPIMAEQHHERGTEL